MAGRPRSEKVDEALRAAAVESFVEHGLAGFTFDDVARRAGASRTTLYRRWATREALLLDALQSWRDGFDGIPSIDRDMPLPALLALLADRVGAAFGDPATRALLRRLLTLGVEANATFRQYLATVAAARRAALTDAIETAQRNGLIDLSLEPSVASDAVAGALAYALLSGTADQPGFDAEDYCWALFKTVGLADRASHRSQSSER